MNSVVTNIGYNTVYKGLTVVVQIVTGAMLARTLNADDFGVVGIAMIVTGFIGQFSNFGVNAALVQREVLTDEVLETSQALNVMFAGVLFLCAEASAPFLTGIFNNAAVPRVVSVLALTFLIGTPGFLPSAMLTREMRFGRLRAPAIMGTVARGLVGVGCALSGLRYWSLVAGMLAGSICTAVMLRIVRPCKAAWRLDVDTSVELLRYGAPLFGSTLLAFLLFNVDNFMIGSRMGAKELGYYTIAFTWASFVCSTLSETVHSVLFPQFSRMQMNRADLAAMYCRSLRAVVFFAAMANAALFAVSDGFLFTVLGKGTPRWLPSLYPLQILCVYGAIRAAVEPIGNVIMALGRTNVLMRASLLAVIPQVCLLPIVIAKWGLPGVACLVCGAYGIQWVLYGPFLKRELGVGTRRILKLTTPALASAVSGVFVSKLIALADPLSWGSIVVRLIAVCLPFIVVHEALTRGSIAGEIGFLLKAGKRNFPVST